MLSSLAPARRRLVLGVVVVVLVAVIAGVIALVAGRDDPVAPVSQQQAGPVVLVPGYGGSTTGVEQLARALRTAGKDATVFTLPGDGRGDLDAQATALGRTIDQVRDRTGAKSVDVVGYSAGGVVARLWVADHGGAGKARRIVTLGAPQHGTDLATLAGSALPSACPAACRQLATDSSLLAGLNAGDETPAGPTWVSIWTRFDDVVVPPDSAVLQGATNVRLQDLCPTNRVRHSGLPTDTDVTAIVRAELATGPVPSLTRCPSCDVQGRCSGLR